VTASTEPTLYPGLPLGVLELDSSRRILDVDATFCRLFSCTRGEMLRRPLEDLLSPRDRRGAVRLATLLSRYKGGLIDIPLGMKVGRTDYYARLRMCASGDGWRAYVEVPADESDLMNEMLVARERWTSVFRRSEDGIAIVDLDGRILENNQRFHELMQFRDAHGILLSELALSGKPLSRLLPPDYIPGLDAFLVGASSAPELRGRHVSKDGCLELQAARLNLPLRGAIGSVVLVRDVTEQRQIEERDAIISEDLVQASAFQEAILGSLPEVPGFDVEVIYRPMDRVGGDLYDVSVLDQTRLRVFVADSVGHGVKAALTTMLIKGEYEALKDEPYSPGDTLFHLNERIFNRYQTLELLFTAVIADIDLATGEITYACGGGHPAPLLLRGGSCDELGGGESGVLGVFARLPVTEAKASMERGDGLVLLTDGILDARSPSKVLFGRRAHAVASEAHVNRRRVAAALCNAVDAFLRPHRQDDDIAVVSIRRR
jgi:PAS domain S-box-containing protein